MLSSFFQNSTLGMTKEAYFEMCEALGSTPIEEEIPVEMDDFPLEVQIAIHVYNKLRDEWEGMSGTYMGKSLVGLKDILDIYEIPFEDRRFLLDWINVMDAERSKAFNAMKSNRDVKSKES